MELEPCPNPISRACFFSFVLCNAPEEKSGHDLPGSRCHTGLRSQAISCFPSHSASFPSLQHATHGERRLVTNRKQWLIFLLTDAKPMLLVLYENHKYKQNTVHKYALRLCKMTKGFKRPTPYALVLLAFFAFLKCIFFFFFQEFTDICLG